MKRLPRFGRHRATALATHTSRDLTGLRWAPWLTGPASLSYSTVDCSCCRWPSGADRAVARSLCQRAALPRVGYYRLALAG